MFATIALLLGAYGLFAQDNSVTTVSILGCHSQDTPAPTIPYLVNTLKPDYCIWVGDNVYADTDDNPQYIQDQLNLLAAKPGFNQLKTQSKFFVTWDDHDYGKNNYGKRYKLKEESKQIHRKFWMLENEIPANHDGIYYSKIEVQPNGKKVQFIMLDGRFNRDRPIKPNGDAFGKNQWKWLEAQLQQPADVRFLVNGYQILLEKPTEWEALIKIGKSRKKLIDLLKKYKVNNALFITGDQHYVEILESDKKLGYHTYEIMSAGINTTEEPGHPANRVAGPDLTTHDATIIEIHWQAAPYLQVKTYNVETGQVNIDYRIELGDIGCKSDCNQK